MYLGVIELPELPFDEVAVALLALVAVVVGVGFGVWAAPSGIAFGKKVWRIITGK